MLRQTLSAILTVLLGAPLAPAAELPVRKAVLYKHGIGFFERAGQVPAGEAARLDFNTAEMNDVLKSLTVEERGGGRVSGVRYDSSEPLDRKLREFPFSIGGAQPLAAFLDQLKGSRVQLQFNGEALAGIIVSARIVPGSERQAEKQEVLLLLDSGDLRTADLLAARTIRFPDPKLQAQLAEYLGAVGQSRNRDKRGVVIESSGRGVRDLIASYVIPMPAWKTSYRLVLDSNPQPLMEGWAIVDNTTGEDWSNISLSLVSGLPVSFVTRLYEPNFVTRPDAELPRDAAQRPVLHAGAIGGAGEALGERDAVAKAAMAPPAPFALMNRVTAARADEASSRREMASSLAAVAQGRELGDLFEYRIDHPITIRKNESAMLPFLQQRIASRKLLIFSEASGSAHPMTAIEINNSTGKTLDGGAITVLEDGSYAGESLMETLKAGDRRLVSYAVDLGTRVTTAFDSENNLLREFRLRRGILTTRTAIREIKTFTIRNVDAKAKTLIIETPVRPEYKLTGLTPAETTASTRRFEVKLAPSATAKFPVTEERVLESSISVASMTPDVLFTYVRNQNLDEPARRKLEPLAALKQKLAATQSELNRTENQMRDLVQDQDRLRQNIGSLNQVNGQQQRVQEYAQRLAAQETQLAGLRDRQAELQKQKAGLEQQIADWIEKAEI